MAQGGTPLRLHAVACGLSDRGMQREHNEDSYIVLGEYNLFIVADGMGGHRAGDVASRIATDTIADFFRSTANEDVTWPFHFDTALTEEENRLVTGIRVANRHILDKSERSRECQGMGTTVVGAMYSPAKNKVFIGHVGDSRCYRVRGGEIKLLTRDHSLLNDYLLAMPELTEEQKAELPKNVITRALGMQKDVVVDLQSDVPLPNDVYLLCSDGLNGMLHDEDIFHMVDDAGPDIITASRKLIDRANANGGEDNITVVLIRIEAETGPIVVGAPSSPMIDEDTVQATTPPASPAAVTSPTADTTPPGPVSDTAPPAAPAPVAIKPVTELARASPRAALRVRNAATDDLRPRDYVPRMPSLAELRRDYSSAGLHERDLDPDPFRQFEKWFDEAKSSGVVEPNAMTLATVDEDGGPSARTVLLKGLSSEGFVFFTNYESRKGHALAARPRAALLFPWVPLERQILIEGDVSRVTREETEAYFRARPRQSKLGAWASNQSDVVSSREVLEGAMRELAGRFPEGTEIPPPPHWGGYRVSPRTIEMWQGRTSRLHDRLRYRRDDATSSWIIERLSP